MNSTTDNNKRSPFHQGEQMVQSRMGVKERIEPWAKQVVRPYMPDQHREFYSQLPYVILAARDLSGAPWVTVIADEPGFLKSPNSRTLRFDTGLLAGDPLQGMLHAGADIGLLGIDLANRRRNRVNGKIGGVFDHGFTFQVGQSFGNCPQYITPRPWETAEPQPVIERDTVLNAEAQKLIANSDTFFIGSGYDGDGSDNIFGMDASHRGGAPGFVKVIDPSQIVFPDYAGNNHFNTIGNLVMDPRVGMAFVDFESGSLIQLTGQATLDFNSDRLKEFPGAQRLVTVRIEQVVYRDNVLPLRWGSASAAYREIVLLERVRESEDVVSFIFSSRDGGELPVFEAGQHLPIQVTIDGEKHHRTYSLSNGPEDGFYRISVKREPKGLVSRFLHDTLEPGTVILAELPNGDFLVQPGSKPVVLLGAGIGVTPMASMLYGLLSSSAKREIHFYHGVRDAAHHPLGDELKAITTQFDHVKHTVVYSGKLPDQTDSVESLAGRISGELLAARLPTIDADYYLCGPLAFLSALTSDLQKLGVPSDQIHSETFGPSAS